MKLIYWGGCFKENDMRKGIYQLNLRVASEQGTPCPTLWIDSYGKDSSQFTKCHIPIPFPRRSVVGRERLAPDRTVGIRFVPLKHDDDGFQFKNIFRIKSSDVAVEGTDLWNVHYDCIAIRPINTPKSGLRIEQPK